MVGDIIAFVYESTRLVLYCVQHSASPLVQSYAGKYVPAISYKIHQANMDPFKKLTINLAGLAIGDGLCDPETVSELVIFLCIKNPFVRSSYVWQKAGIYVTSQIGPMRKLNYFVYRWLRALAMFDVHFKHSGVRLINYAKLQSPLCVFLLFL